MEASDGFSFAIGVNCIFPWSDILWNGNIVERHQWAGATLKQKQQRCFSCFLQREVFFLFCLGVFFFHYYYYYYYYYLFIYLFMYIKRQKFHRLASSVLDVILKRNYELPWNWFYFFSFFLKTKNYFQINMFDTSSIENNFLKIGFFFGTLF